jgi:hypothetical protein
MYRSTLLLSGLVTVATLGVLSIGAPTVSAGSSHGCNKKSSHSKSCVDSRDSSSSSKYKRRDGVRDSKHETPAPKHSKQSPNKYVAKNDDNKGKSHSDKSTSNKDCKPHKTVEKDHKKPVATKPKASTPVSVTNPVATVASAAPAPVAKTALANTGSNLAISALAIILIASAIYVARHKQNV